jgi:HlyD family secretion protein
MSTTRIRWIVVALLGAAAASALVFLFWPRPVDVDAATVDCGPIADVVADQGTARVRRAYVVSAPVGGRIERLPLEVGDAVVAGTTAVATIRPAAPELLDPRSHAQAASAVEASRAALAGAIAARDRLAAEAARTRMQFARIAELAREHVVATQEFDNSKADADAAAHALRTAEAEVANRRAMLTSAELTLADPRSPGTRATAVISPASGVVTRLLQQSERTVAAGTPLVEVGETSGLEAAIEFLSQDAVRIRPGQKAAIYDWGGSQELPAEVRRVEPQGFPKVSALGVEEQRTLVILRFTGPSSGWAGLAPGYRVWGRVYLRELASAVIAPLGALVRDGGQWAAYRIEQGRARLRPLQVGTLTDRQAEIVAGVAPGDVVIVYPSDQVRDGLRVRVRR